ncbi:MAG: hypothetical protein AB7W59_10080 [Acidimicrobiia bacterium]
MIRRGLPTGAVALLVAAALGLTACGASDDSGASNASASSATTGSNSAESAPARTFVGELPGTDALVAVTVDGDKAWAYLCDGTADDEGTLANYLTGSFDGSALRATDDDGVSIEATIGTAATGTVTLPGGKTASFQAQPATGDAGWFNAVETTDGRVETGSWIRLSDGSLRGKVVAVDTSSSGGGTTEPDNLEGGSVPPTAVATKGGGLRCFLVTRRFIKDQVAFTDADFDQRVDELNAACS